MTPNNRANFGSKLGAILAAAGSAVGLGNIWRFPYETGEHGGAAFILVYIGCVLLFGVPIMIAEFSIGRRSRANTARAYQILAPGTPWRWVGRMGVLAGFLILSYYSVVAGWTLEFICEAGSNSFSGKSAADFIASFNGFVSHPWHPVVWLVLFLLATHFIIVKGVEKGIEKSSKIMMPLLFILLLASCDKEEHKEEYPLPDGQGALVIDWESETEVNSLAVYLSLQFSHRKIYSTVVFTNQN